MVVVVVEDERRSAGRDCDYRVMTRVGIISRVLHL